MRLSDDRLRKVTSRTQKRANRSVMPNRYMNFFDDVMKELIAHGEGVLLDRMPGWQDPVHLAAEVEALCAWRALKHWGTRHGLYHPYRPRLQLDQAA